MKKVWKITSLPGHARTVYEAAGKVFEIPEYEEVLAFLDGGPVPALRVQSGPFTGPRVGLMQGYPRDGSGHGGYYPDQYVLVETNGGREVTVSRHGVDIYFSTRNAPPSREAAEGVICHLWGVSVDDVATIYFWDADFTSIPDGDYEFSRADAV